MFREVIITVVVVRCAENKKNDNYKKWKIKENSSC